MDSIKAVIFYGLLTSAAVADTVDTEFANVQCVGNDMTSVSVIPVNPDENRYRVVYRSYEGGELRGTRLKRVVSDDGSGDWTWQFLASSDSKRGELPIVFAFHSIGEGEFKAEYHDLSDHTHAYENCIIQTD